MMMGIDEPRSNNFPIAVNLGSILRFNSMSDLNDTIIFNQDIGVSKSDDIVLRIMLQHGTVLKEKSRSHGEIYTFEQCQEQLSM